MQLTKSPNRLAFLSKLIEQTASGSRGARFSGFPFGYRALIDANKIR